MAELQSIADDIAAAVEAERARVDAGEPRFTFAVLHTACTDLCEADRLRVFRALPRPLQQQAAEACLLALGYRVDPAEDLGPGVLSEKAVRDLARAIVTAWVVRLATPDPEPRRRRPQVPQAARSDDVLLSIDPPVYVEALAGVWVPPSGMIRCPFHGDGQERTPSCKVYPAAGEGWFCWGCSRGGTIFDFGAELWGLSTRGEDFIELRGRLARELLGRAA